MIEPVAEELDIPNDHIYANRLLFDDSGEYQGFDVDQPTSKNGGKAAVIDIVKKQYSLEEVVMIGDGTRY